MTRDGIKNSAIIYAGYEYQTLHGLQVLADWLFAPTRYKAIRFECNDEDVAPVGLDDILAVRRDDTYEYWQVKYTPSPEKNPFTWDWLLEKSGKTARSRPLARKWFDALKKLDPSCLASAQLVTNRIPDREIEGCLTEAHLDYSKAPAATRAALEKVLDGYENVNWLFQHLRIVHSDKSFSRLEQSVRSDLLRHADEAAIDRLMLRAREWAIFKEQPPPDGWITLELIRSILSARRPEPIPEDFTIPDGYQVPDEVFHKEFLAAIHSGVGTGLALVGPPGRGKSTYLSAICNTLDALKTPYVRHHYFLSLKDSTGDRRSSWVVAQSLLTQIDLFYAKAGAKTSGKSNLREALAACAKYFQGQGKPFVVVIDGLDHVWRDNAADKRPLDEVFAQLIPPPENAVIVVGTQPVDDAYLPDRLLAAVPRATWRELPPMSVSAIRTYLGTQVTDGKLNPVRDGEIEGPLSECAIALQKRTSGHPLNVIYAVEQLIAGGGRLRPWDIEQLPAELGADVRIYYAYLWSKLLHSQRDMLYLLVAVPFYWPQNAFGEITVMAGHAPAPISAVEHLLYNTDAGLRPFHESLIVFVKEQLEFRARADALLPFVEAWLQTKAPINLRNNWLWSVQALLGRPDALINGLQRDWILDRVADGYSVHMPVRLLTEAEERGFPAKRYADAYRLRRLKSRLLNGPEFQISDNHRLKACSWILAKDESVLAEAYASRHELEISDLVALALAFHQRRDKARATRCARDAVRRHRGNSRYVVDRHRQNWRKEVLLLCKVIGRLDLMGDDELGQSPMFNSKWEEPANALVAANSTERNLARLVELTQTLERPFARKQAQDAAIRVSAITGANIHEWTEFRRFSHSPLAGCWAFLTGTPIQDLRTVAFKSDWMKSLNTEQQQYWLNEFIHEWFFGSVLLAFTAAGSFSWLPAPKFERRALISTYIEELTKIAAAVATVWKSDGRIDFGELFKRLRSKEKPRRGDYEEYESYVQFSRALNAVARDCQLLSVAVGGSFEVQQEAMAVAELSPWFNRHVFLSEYVEQGLLYLDPALVTRIVTARVTEFSSKVTDTSECAEATLELCELLLMHGMDDAANPLCRLCWDYVLGYDHHKDITIITTLEAIGDLVEKAPTEARRALTSIAAQVHHVTDYTDGDETRHAHKYVDDILARLDRVALIDKYDEHISMGDWHRADDSLQSYFEVCDLRSPAVEAIARTGLPAPALNVIKKRQLAGEEAAARILNLAHGHLGTQSDSDVRKVDAGEKESSVRDETKNFEGKVEDYPPERLDALMNDLKESHTFDGHTYLPKWFNYWEKAGRGSELLKVLTPRLESDDVRDRGWEHLLDGAFELCVRLKGKAAAFELAVQAQKHLGGWGDFFESREKSERRLRHVADLYVDRADEFIVRSAKAWIRHRSQPSATDIPGDRLVLFLVQLNRIEEAIGLVQEMTAALQQETRNLPLTSPAWAVLK